MKWNNDYSDDGHYLLVRHLIRHGPTSSAEWQVCYSKKGGPPYNRSLAVFDRKRDAMVYAKNHALAQQEQPT